MQRTNDVVWGAYQIKVLQVWASNLGWALSKYVWDICAPKSLQMSEEIWGNNEVSMQYSFKTKFSLSLCS